MIASKLHRAAPVTFVTLTLFAAAGAFAASAVNKDRSGTAVEGYDVVAYFTEGRPVEGSPGYSYEWKGATWRFASQEHRDLFAADPTKYAPQYGGYCAYAVSQGATAGIDPQAWTIHDGKLYLNLDLRIRQTWSRDIPGYVAKADASWPKLSGEPAPASANP